MNDSWRMRITPRTASRLKTLAVLVLMGSLLILALCLLWLVENHRS